MHVHVFYTCTCTFYTCTCTYIIIQNVHVQSVHEETTGHIMPAAVAPGFIAKSKQTMRHAVSMKRLLKVSLHVPIKQQSKQHSDEFGLPEVIFSDVNLLTTLANSHFVMETSNCDNSSHIPLITSSVEQLIQTSLLAVASSSLEYIYTCTCIYMYVYVYRLYMYMYMFIIMF